MHNADLVQERYLAMVLSAEVEKARANRFRFLKLFYERTGGDEYKWFNMFEVGQDLGFEKDETSRVTQYLVGENLVIHRAVGGLIGITHWGIREMESALSNPNQPTKYFPPAVNIIEVHGDIVGSQIQQATQTSAQQIISPDVQRALTEFLSKLEADLAEVTRTLDKAKLVDLTADLDTVKAQLKASEPKRSIVKEALSSIRSILEGAGATLLAAEAIRLLSML
jgi:hypothetical protein